MKLKINRIVIGIFAAIMAVTSVPFAPVMAAGCANGSFAFPRWYDNLCDSNGQIKSPNGDGSGTADSTAKNIGGWIAVIAMNIVQMLHYVVGYVSLGFIIYGGFKYMLSGDSSSGTVAARKTIQNAIIGLVLSIMSIAIIKFVTAGIGGS